MISFRNISVNPVEACNKLFLVYTLSCSFKSHSDKIKKIKEPSSESGIYVALNKTQKDWSGIFLMKVILLSISLAHKHLSRKDMNILLR